MNSISNPCSEIKRSFGWWLCCVRNISKTVKTVWFGGGDMLLIFTQLKLGVNGKVTLTPQIIYEKKLKTSKIVNPCSENTRSFVWQLCRAKN